MGESFLQPHATSGEALPQLVKGFGRWTRDAVGRRTDREPSEVEALARLAFDELARGMFGIGDIHAAIANRVFTHVGAQGGMARQAHEAISTGVYAGIAAGSSGLGRVAARVLAQTSSSQRSLSPTPIGGGMLGVIDGLIGDELERQESVLQEPMAVRVDSRVVACEPNEIARCFPDATRRVVVFVHGLMATEFPFSWFAAQNGGTYGTRLERDLGATPVYVRYNTGRHISENGRSLAELLEQLFAAWPVQIDEIALIGHSMGGLVARSACYCATQNGDPWVRRVRHVVSLGTPHMGAPLAQAVHYASAGLNVWPETRPLAALLRRRGGGIRDLRQGSLVDEDWTDCDPDELRAVACKEVPLLEGATHCFVAATIMQSERNALSRLIGDLLVLQPSASGRSRSRRIPFQAEYGMHLGAAHHLALLNHPAVYERIRDWFATPPSQLATASD